MLCRQFFFIVYLLLIGVGGSVLSACESCKSNSVSIVLNNDADLPKKMPIADKAEIVHKGNMPSHHPSGRQWTDAERAEHAERQRRQLQGVNQRRVFIPQCQACGWVGRATMSEGAALLEGEDHTRAKGADHMVVVHGRNRHHS